MTESSFDESTSNLSRRDILRIFGGVGAGLTASAFGIFLAKETGKHLEQDLFSDLADEFYNKRSTKIEDYSALTAFILTMLAEERWSMADEPQLHSFSIRVVYNNDEFINIRSSHDGLSVDISDSMREETLPRTKPNQLVSHPGKINSLYSKIVSRLLDKDRAQNINFIFINTLGERVPSGEVPDIPKTLEAYNTAEDPFPKFYARNYKRVHLTFIKGDAPPFKTRENLIHIIKPIGNIGEYANLLELNEAETKGKDSNSWYISKGKKIHAFVSPNAHLDYQKIEQDKGKLFRKWWKKIKGLRYTLPPEPQKTYVT